MGAQAWPFGGLCPGPEGWGCGTRCAQTVLAPISNSGLGRSLAWRRHGLTDRHGLRRHAARAGHYRAQAKPP